MHDMLVRLYDLPSLEDALESASRRGVTIRPALTPERPQVLEWMRANFDVWAAEAEAAFCRLPVSCLLAVRDQDLLGFACYDATCRNFFGPTAVLEEERGNGLGRSLLLAALHAQRAQGYAYSIPGRLLQSSRHPCGVLARTR
jgi:GNAT superfamily N-acetyltransferase